MRNVNVRRKWLASAILISVIILGITIVLVQFNLQKAKVAEEKGISPKTAESFRSLTASDGLFNLPELGDANTLESRINATFMVSEMARNSDVIIANKDTANSLYSYAKNPNNPLVLRLKAYYALRNLKDKRWLEASPLVKQVNDTLPLSVTEADVAEYLAIAEPLDLLDDNFRPRTKLVPFDPSDNEQSERLATSTIILKYLFANSAEIPGYFKTMQSKLCSWASGDAQYVQQTLFAANALIGTNDSTCINKEYIRNLYGCRDSSQLISIDGSDSGHCSLTLTYFTYRLGITN